MGSALLETNLYITKNKMWKNYKEEQEYLWWLREDKVLGLQELMSVWIFKMLITNPKDIEFKIRPWYDYVSVFDKWDFMCYITKEQAMEFIDDQSKLNQTINQHFIK